MIKRHEVIESQNRSRKHQRKVYQHQRVVNDMLKLIGATPMDDELKMILRMRIWGTNPNVFAPMSHAQIAVNLKCRIRDVERWEEDAVGNVKVYIKRTGMIAAGEKFDKDNKIETLINPQKRIIV